MGFRVLSTSERKRAKSRELNDELEPARKVQALSILMGPEQVTDGSRSEPSVTPAQWTRRESIELG